jgi:hypothetical protein
MDLWKIQHGCRIYGNQAGIKEPGGMQRSPGWHIICDNHSILPVFMFTAAFSLSNFNRIIAQQLKKLIK